MNFQPFACPEMQLDTAHGGAHFVGSATRTESVIKHLRIKIHRFRKNRHSNPMLRYGRYISSWWSL